MTDRTTWWKQGIVYQIYPRSFQDSNGDGIGDLPGLIRRLDYVSSLGVDAIWLSPIYPSPMADFGYDVSDYCGIHPLFGTQDDFDRLLDGAHVRGLKVILDFVPNHSSDRHPWFQDSRSARDSPKRDWYIWHDPGPDGGPPNNWLSEFGGPAWTFDGATGQYYYHAFLSAQPDLNWRNRAVRAAMYDVLRFWLERGVDGFRIDALWHLIKDDRFRDNLLNPGFVPGDVPSRRLIPLYTADRPEVHEVVAEMRQVIDTYSGRVLIGELYLPIERLVGYYGADLSGLHLPFNFQLINASWNAHEIAGLVADYERALPEGGWPNWVLGNHDKSRIASRIGRPQARVAAMLLLTLRGTPTLYYGDEIGMRDVPIPPELVQDPLEKNVPGLGLGRDPQRTPMQWDDSPQAGFSTAEPWLPLAPDHRDWNVAAQERDPGGLLNLYRRLAALRRRHPALHIGAYQPVPTQGSVLAYRRRHQDECILVALNLGGAPARVHLSGPGAQRGRVLLSTHTDRMDETVDGAAELHGNEGLVILLS